MFHQIGRGPSNRDENRGVAPRLEECHERIRRSTAIALRLAGDDGAPADDVRAAANAVIGYFVRSLPHHSADEDESIAPHLVELAGLSDVLAAVRAQHVEIHAALDRMVPLWQQVADEPARRDALREALRAGVERLQALFDEHLGLEEARLFPAIERLPAETQEQIIAEMIARRQ